MVDDMKWLKHTTIYIRPIETTNEANKATFPMSIPAFVAYVQK